VAARKPAEYTANTRRRLFSVQLLVIEVDSALREAAHIGQFITGHNVHFIDLQLDYNKLLCVPCNMNLVT